MKISSAKDTMKPLKGLDEQGVIAATTIIREIIATAAIMVSAYSSGKRIISR